MNDIQIFNNPDFGDIRTLNIDGEPWFVGKDVADILGYQNASKALADHVDDEDKLNNESLSSLGQRGGWLINESGLFSLVLSSKLPNAKSFKRWVTYDVLPSIRKTGSYSIIDRSSLSPQTQFLIQTAESIAMLESRQNKLEQRTDDHEAKLAYFDGVLKNIKDAYALSFGDWRGNVNKYVYKISKARNMEVKDVYVELYDELKTRSGSKLDKSDLGGRDL